MDEIWLFIAFGFGWLCCWFLFIGILLPTNIQMRGYLKKRLKNKGDTLQLLAISLFIVISLLGTGFLMCAHTCKEVLLNG